jgi:hypothetical protein
VQHIQRALGLTELFESQLTLCQYRDCGLVPDGQDQEVRRPLFFCSTGNVVLE